MKNSLKTLLIVVAAFVGGFAAVVFFQTTEKAYAEDSRSVFDAIKFAPTRVPTSPSFAGEKVPVNIYDVKERLDREILVNTYWHSNTFQNFKNAYRYFPTIEKILKEEGVPDDFKYLALAESGLRNVVSPSNAVGVWQFLKDTGIQFGLEVNDVVDERYHLEKSTRAACKYLKQAKEQFGSWTLAAASYNVGQARVRKSIAEQKVSSYYDLHLNEETSRYVFRIVALKELFNDPQKYGFYFTEEDMYQPLNYKTVKVDTAITDLVEFAIENKINYKALKLHNPWMRQQRLDNKSGKVYEINIPS
jgi:hypothetical protein